MVETSWTKIDDGFCMHPKILAAGNTATGVYVRMLSYCGCYLTDGLVPATVAPTIAGADTDAIDALERVGLIQRLESGGVVILDYLDYNRSKAQIAADREIKRTNGSKGGRPRMNGKRP